MGLDVLRPLDVAVGGIGEVARLEHQQHPLAGDDIDGSLQQGADIPGDPLFTVTQQDEHTIGDADRTGAGIQVADDGFQCRRGGKQALDLQRGEEIAYHHRPQNNAGEYKNLLLSRQAADLGEFFLLPVLVTVPIDKADDINGDPEEQRGGHSGEAVGKHHADKDLGDLHAQ